LDIGDFESMPFTGEFPKAVQGYLGLKSLQDIVNGSNANGATRLLTCLPFEPLEAMTLTFSRGEVHASHVVSDADAWERIACGDTSADDSEFVSRERTFEIPNFPTVMQGWQRIADAIERADSCMSDNADGISFFHLAFANDVDSMRVWFNPTVGANPLQCLVLDGYMQIKSWLEHA
jgi:hypothetical protein